MRGGEGGLIIVIVRKLVSNITGHSEETISKNQEIARLAVTKSFLLAGRTLLYITLHYFTLHTYLHNIKLTRFSISHI